MHIQCNNPLLRGILSFALEKMKPLVNQKCARTYTPGMQKKNKKTTFSKIFYSKIYPDTDSLLYISRKRSGIFHNSHNYSGSWYTQVRAV